MRLTLRTLLAWLDNLLSPQDQQILGDKVARSPDAAKLIRRIRETVARGKLPAPRLDGRGLAHDPNKAAEYLDNMLEPDLLAEFEKVCLQSDVHLAEIAASHGLLAEVFRDPGLVQPLGAAEKKRLLLAVQQQLEKPRAIHREPAATADGSAPPAPAAAGEPCDTVFVSPATLATASAGEAARAAVTSATKRRSRRAAWLTLAAAAAVLLALIGVLIWSLSRRDKRDIAVAARAAAAPQPRAVQAPIPSAHEPADEKQPDPPAKPAAEVRAAAVPPASPPTESAPPRTNLAEDAATAAARPKAVASPAAVAGPAPVAGPAAGDEKPAAPPPAVEPAAGTVAGGTPPRVPPAAAVEQARVPQGDALAIAAGPPAGVAAATPATQPAPPATAGAVLQPPAPAAAAATSGIILDRGLVLRREPANAGQNFQGVASGGEIKAGDDLLAPAACRPVISVGGVQLALEPNSRVMVTRDADGTPRLELLFGRAVATSPVAAARLGVSAGALSGVIAAGLRAPVGIEVSLTLDAAADPGESEAHTTARIVTGPSAIAWQQTQADGTPAHEPLRGIAPQGMLDAAAALVWDSRDPGGVVVQRRSAAEWVPGQERSDRIEDAAGQALQAAVADGKPVEEALRTLVGDRRAENRMAAAATLALLGDYGPLVDLLCAESGTQGLKESEWSRLEQSAVPLALARGAKSAARLQQAFEAKLPEEESAELFALARGVGAAAVEADGGQRLVAALESDRLVVRRYAFKNLVDIVRPSATDRLRYRPDRPAEQRRDGVAWWRRQLADGRIRHAPASGDSDAPPVE